MIPNRTLDQPLLLDYIKMDIEKKYNIKNPIFMCNNQILSGDELYNFINKTEAQYRWVQYKYIADNTFELKSFFSHPLDEVCYKLVNDFFQSLHGPIFLSQEPQFIVEEQKGNVFYQIGETIYNRKQAERVLFSVLRSGSTDLCINGEIMPDPNPQKNRFIINVIGQDNELYFQVTSGYLLLEYKD